MRTAYARITLAVLGVATLSTVGTGRYRSYVRSGMAWPLLVTGAVLVALALHGGLRQWRRHDEARTLARYGAGHPSREDHDHDHGGIDAPHGRSWVLLLAPVACLTLLAPQALGSYSAARAVDAAQVRPVRGVEAGADQVDLSALDTDDEGWAAWEPLPVGDVVPLSLGEFITRAQWDSSRSLTGRTVRLTGFALRSGAAEAQVAGSADTDWTLARMSIMCCAADAAVYRVRIQDQAVSHPDDGPAEDTWVEVEGRWVPGPLARTDGKARLPDPVLAVTRVTPVPAPTDPYE